MNCGRRRAGTCWSKVLEIISWRGEGGVLSCCRRTPRQGCSRRKKESSADLREEVRVSQGSPCSRACLWLASYGVLSSLAHELPRVPYPDCFELVACGIACPCYLVRLPVSRFPCPVCRRDSFKRGLPEKGAMAENASKTRTQ